MLWLLGCVLLNLLQMDVALASDQHFVLQMMTAQKPNVESLYTEIREDYDLAMKKAIIDYKRRDPVEEDRMDVLRLPPRELDPVYV